MKKVVFIFGAISLMYSCNEIMAEDYLLTDSNTDYLKINYEYWYSEHLAEGSEKFIQLIDFDYPSKRKLWAIAFYPKDKKNPPLYLRAIKLKKEKILFQITSLDNNKKEIQFIHGEQPNDSTFYFYPYNSKLFTSAKNNRNLKRVGNNLTLTSDKISFDSIAIAKNSKAILRFLKKDMNKRYNFIEDTLIFRGYHSPKLN